MLVMYIIFYLEKLNMSYLIIEFLSQKKNRNHICQNYQNIFYIDQNL